MMPRSQTIALVVLFVTLGLVFAVAAEVGVSTKVFTPQSTLTSTPTVTLSPTPTPGADVRAKNWTEVQPGSLTYAPRPDLQTFPLTYQTMTLDSFVQQNNGTPIPAGTKYPLVEAMNQFRAELEKQVEQYGLVVAPEALTGPDIDVIGSEQVVRVRITVAPQTASGQEFPGLDMTELLVDTGGGNILSILYRMPGVEDPKAYADFQAWVEVNLADLVKKAEATPTPGTGTPGTETTPAETPNPAAATPGTPAAESGTPVPTTLLPTAAGAATLPPTPAETVQPTAEAVTSVPATQAATPEATPVAEAPTAVPATPEATPQATTEATTVALTPGQKWVEQTPGEVVYASNPKATIGYGALPLSEYAARQGVQVPTGQTLTITDLLTQMKTNIMQMFQTNQIVLETNGFEGPQTEVFNGVTVTYLHLSLKTQTTAGGQSISGQELFLGVIDLGGGQVQLVIFANQGEPDPAIYADFKTWLSDNAARLSIPPTPTPTLEATGTSGTPEPTATAAQ